MVLEKAWAKIYGNYQRIDGGQAYQTLRDLTGAPAYELVIEDEIENGLWDKILKYDEANYIMCAGIDGGDADSEEK